MPNAPNEPEAVPRWKVLGALLLLGSLWGGSFPLIKTAAPALGPVGVTHARLAVGAMVLTLLTLTSRRMWQIVGRRFAAFLVLAALNVAGPLTLVAVAIVGLNASMAAILNATTPLFTVVVAAIWLGHRISWRHALGVALGVAGVVVLLGGAPVGLDGRGLMSTAASLAAAVLYALGGVYARRAFPEEAPLTVALGQLVAATVMMIPVTIVTIGLSRPSAPVTRETVLAVLIVGVGATAGGYLLYFWIIRTAGPFAASTVTFLVPLAGAGLGVLWLSEPVTSGLVLGLIIILLGVGLPTQSSKRTTERDN
ncbi:DMT family transporter [Nocardioides deserti]|uniref:DMT family transporter n=1 Tax=Nocardioides deserti TaxID=1588644 RepID=A0ABR6U4R5_9ACTN|nr:DMT family transporter [Nocardioides deserti]